MKGSCAECSQDALDEGERQKRWLDRMEKREYDLLYHSFNMELIFRFRTQIQVLRYFIKLSLPPPSLPPPSQPPSSPRKSSPNKAKAGAAPPERVAPLT
jgi:hypothetical protein